MLYLRAAGLTAFQTRTMATVAGDAKAAIRKQLRALPKASIAAPRRPPSSYALFVKEQSGSGASFSDIGKKWKALSNSSVQSYKDRAEKLQTRYRGELAEFLAKRPAADVVLEGKRHALREALAGRSIARPVAVRTAHADAPTRPKSAYLIFYSDIVRGGTPLQHKYLGRSLDGIEFPDIARTVASAWRDLSQSARQDFERRAATARSEYVRLRDSFNREHKVDDVRKEVNQLLKRAVAPKKKAVAKPKAKKVAAKAKKTAVKAKKSAAKPKAKKTAK